MARSKDVVIASLSFVLFFSAAACSVKEEKKSERLSYQYNVNGCDTGNQSFGDLKSYCDTLIDDAKNNFCAKSLRQQEFDLKCRGLAQKQDQDATTSNGPQDRPQAPRSEGGILPDLTTPKPSIAKTLPEEIVVEAHFEKMIQVSPKDSGEELIATLEGKVIIDSIHPQIEKKLKIDEAENAIFAVDSELGDCELSIHQYKIESDNSAIHFTMVGVDKKDQLDGSGCMARLSTMAMTGFAIEFRNVPVGGALSQDVIPKVLLKVKAKE